MFSHSRRQWDAQQRDAKQTDCGRVSSNLAVPAVFEGVVAFDQGGFVLHHGVNHGRLDKWVTEPYIVPAPVVDLEGGERERERERKRRGGGWTLSERTRSYGSALGRDVCMAHPQCRC